MRTLITPLQLLAACTLGMALPASAQNPCASTADLPTPYDANNGLDGIMFDVTALSNITINCFEINLSAGDYYAVIKHKNGTHAGFATMPSAWTAIDSTQLVTAGPGQPTYLPINVNVPVLAGETHAFYISNLNTNGAGTRYTDGASFGAVFASNGDLQIKEGTGINYPFGFNLSPRKFNGTIYYSNGTTSVPELPVQQPVSVWPNPANAMIHVNGHPNATIVITNGLGQEVLRTTWSRELDVSRLAPGSYVLSMLEPSTGRIGSTMLVMER